MGYERAKMNTYAQINAHKSQKHAKDKQKTVYPPPNESFKNSSGGVESKREYFLGG